VPGRSMPEAIDPNGNLVDLPPLPEALASADLDRIKPEPNQPSPHAPIQSAPSTDPALARTSFDAAPTAPNAPTVYLDVAGHVVEFSDVLVALGKAGMKVDNAGDEKVPTNKADVQIDFDFDIAEAPKVPSSKTPCEKCDGDSTFCPANAKSMTAAGGIKLVPVGTSTKHAMTGPISDFAAFLDAVENKAEAVKRLGQTKTTVVPIGDNVSIELKATIVPTEPEKAKAAAKNSETPNTRR
jgi:hypothetical protein